MDLVGYPLAEAEARLQGKNLLYTVQRAASQRDFFKVDENDLYIVRQTRAKDGVYHFVAAAKMLRKEV